MRSVSSVRSFPLCLRFQFSISFSSSRYSFVQLALVCTPSIFWTTASFPFPLRLSPPFASCSISLAFNPAPPPPPPLFRLRDDHYIVLVLKVRRFDPDIKEVSRNKSGTPPHRTLFQTFTSTHFCLYLASQFFCCHLHHKTKAALGRTCMRNVCEWVSDMEQLKRSYVLMYVRKYKSLSPRIGPS